jgi:hypothetical protein
MAREPKTDEQRRATPAAPSKISLVVDLLRRERGASLDEMVEVTGWLPHTTRAALTGLKKKGHVIDKAKIDGVTRYTIVAVASA